jgi:hypothetical protein
VPGLVEGKPYKLWVIRRANYVSYLLQSEQMRFDGATGDRFKPLKQAPKAIARLKSL